MKIGGSPSSDHEHYRPDDDSESQSQNRCSRDGSAHPIPRDFPKVPLEHPANVSEESPEGRKPPRWRNPRPIASIRLPQGIVSWPPQQADTPTFCRTIARQGATPRPLYIDGPSLRHVHVAHGTAVYCRATSHRNKVYVHFYDPSTHLTLGVETAMGHPYFAPIDGQVDWTNVNGKAFSANQPGLRIVCRHLVLDEALRQQKHAHDKAGSDSPPRRLTQRRIEQIGTAELAGQSVRTDLDMRLNELISQARENCIVGHSQWGTFCAQAFSGMQPGEAQHWVIITGDHAMLLTLSVKPHNDGHRRYVAKIYDPNFSLTHGRIVEDHFGEVAKWDIKILLLSDKTRNAYYGRPDGPHPSVTSLLQRIPPNAFLREHGAPWFDGPIERNITTFVAADEIDNPARFFHLLASGFPLDGLDACLTRCKTPDEVFRLFEAGIEAASGLYMAMQEGYTQGVESFGEHLLNAPAAAMLSTEQVADLLAARQTSTSTVRGLVMAAGNRKARTIRAWGHICLKLHAAGRLSADQMFRLLDGESSDHSAWSTALLIGDAQTIVAIGELLVAAGSAGALTNAQLIALLEAVDRQGVTAMEAVMIMNLPAAIEAYGNIILSARAGSLLTNDQLKRLLTAKDIGAEDPPGDGQGLGSLLLMRAMMEKGRPAREAAIGKAEALGYLTLQDVENLLGATSGKTRPES